MNKPAPKEPSMDEILSSIRQIIADDDAGPAPRRPGVLAMPMGAELAADPVEPVEAAEPEPLTLSPEQIMRDDAAADDDDEPSDEEMNRLLGGTDDEELDPPPLVDPEDVSFEEEDDPEPVPVVMAPPPPPQPRRAPAPQPMAQAARLPDSRLTADMADELLGPTAESAVKSTLGKLNNLSMVGSGITLEDLMRQMLRPMLKEWLDENLPSVVERMVEKEIERVSRGGR